MLKIAGAAMQAMMDVVGGLTTLDTVKNRRWAVLGQQSPAPKQKN